MRKYEIVIGEEPKAEINIYEIIKEPCDILNQLVQYLSNSWNDVKEYLRILLKQEDTARQEQKQKQGRKAGISKYIVKWREKYRPP